MSERLTGFFYELDEFGNNLSTFYHNMNTNHLIDKNFYPGDGDTRYQAEEIAEDYLTLSRGYMWSHNDFPKLCGRIAQFLDTARECDSGDPHILTADDLEAAVLEDMPDWNLWSEED